MVRVRNRKCLIGCLLLVVSAALAYYTVYHSRLLLYIDVGALRGYPECLVKETELFFYNSTYPCDFQLQPRTRFIVVTFINSAWLSLAKNWVCSAEAVGLKKHLYLIAFEERVCSQLSRDIGDVRCYQYPNVNIERSEFSNPGYRKFMLERTIAILKLLSCGIRLLIVDADMFFMKNPLPYLDSALEDKELLFQAGSTEVRVVDYFMPYMVHYICAGLVYMKPVDSIKRLWLGVLQYQRNFLWNDQAGLNICIRHHSNFNRIRWSTLDPEYFPNGQHFFAYSQGGNHSFLVHANHLRGSRKMLRLVASGFWCDKKSGMLMCRNRALYASVGCRNRATRQEWCRDYVRVCRDRFHIAI